MKTSKTLLMLAVFFVCFCLNDVVSRQRESKPFSPDVSIANPAYNKGEGPKVLVDEGHYNHRDTASYKAAVDMIVNDGYSVAVNKAKFTEDVLEGCDILIVANALHEKNVNWWEKTEHHYPAFAQEEVDSVYKWVKRGGGLFLIADHEPFGTAALNLAKKFQVTMSEGTAYDPDNPDAKRGGILARGHTIAFTRKNGTLLDHPVTRGRDETEKINTVRTFGGQSLLAPDGSGILKFSESAYDVAPLSKEKRKVPHHLQGAAFGFGAGRVVVMGEARIFRFHWLIRPEGNVVRGKRGEGGSLPPDDSKQFLLNIMHYLSRLLEPGITIEKCP